MSEEEKKEKRKPDVGERMGAVMFVTIVGIIICMIVAIVTR